jgi:hypothetical protein
MKLLPERRVVQDGNPVGWQVGPDGPTCACERALGVLVRLLPVQVLGRLEMLVLDGVIRRISSRVVP